MFNIPCQITYLTNTRDICLIRVTAASSKLAAQFFGNETIAHDKGKPVARQGRKAKSLPRPGRSSERARDGGRWSGCRRRSEIVRAPFAHAAGVSAQVRGGVKQPPVPEACAPAAQGAQAGTTGEHCPRVVGSQTSVVPFPLRSYPQSASTPTPVAPRRKRRSLVFARPVAALRAGHRAPSSPPVSRPAAGHTTEMKGSQDVQP
jgi:hypothetical protein